MALTRVMKFNFKPVKVSEILAKFPELLKLESGKLDTLIHGVSGEDHPQNHTICFASDFSRIGNTELKEGLLVVDQSTLKKSAQFKNQIPKTLTVISTDLLQIAMAKVNRLFFDPSPSEHVFGIHKTAVIAEGCKISAKAIVGPYVVVGRNVTIEDHAQIDAHAYIGESSQIGAYSKIESHVHIGARVEIGSRCRIQPHSVIGKEGFGFATDKNGQHTRKPHYGKVILHNSVEVGSNVSIDRGTFDDTVIGEGTKIDNMCHIAHNLKIGKNCFITAGFVVAGSTEIGDNCMFGGGTLVAGHIKIGNGIQAAGGSIIHKSVDKPGQYGGYPFLPLSQALKNLSSFAGLSKLRREVSEVKRKIKDTEHG